MNGSTIRMIYLPMLALLIFSCASKKDNVSADQKTWPAMDDFHMIMAETFHPYMDSANLAPAKSRAGELAASAETWAESELPARVNNDAMKEKLKTLKAETAALQQTVAAGIDEKIATQLTKIHDLFHAIQEDWYGGH